MSLHTTETAKGNYTAGGVHDEQQPMRVRKRNGELQEVHTDKITDLVKRCCNGLTVVDPALVAAKAISGIYDGVSTTELDQLLMHTAAMMSAEDPEYSKLAARLLHHFVEDEVRTVGVSSFQESIHYGFKVGLLAEDTYKFVEANAAVLNQAIDIECSDLFEYFGLRTVYDRYLLKDPMSRQVFETPQYFFMRVACGLSKSAEEAIQFYQLISSFEYMPSTPTLFNSATRRPQMSSCYLLDSPEDSLEAIYDKYKDVALLSKFAGGIGLSYTRVRSRGALIRGTNGKSNGIIPFLKTLDSSVSAVNQGGKRKGACCIYLESWHSDILDFLQLRENTGDESLRTYNLNTANWVPDLFMNRVETDGMWSLFDPSTVPQLVDLYGAEFEKAYVEAEEKGLYAQQIKARDLYAAMMKSLAQTGNGWMTFKDASNKKANQTGKNPANVIHLSNLCTEIIEVTSKAETAVCNLGSINISRYVAGNTVDYARLAKNVQVAVKYLDRVVDINFYPIPQAESSNKRWRPVGLGLMGLQDVFFQLNLPFDAPEAREVSRKVQEEIYYNALLASCELAEKDGAHPGFEETKLSDGIFQFELWGVKPENMDRWEALRQRIKKSGVRNSLLIAIAPTATIASICGSYECIEPQVSNLFKRETLSGEFLQINHYLVKRLKEIGMWNSATKDTIKMADGSIQGVADLPEDVKNVYRTVWELPMRSLIDMAADRGAYIDQSQSLNLFIESPTIGKLSSMYNYAWKKGLKSTYYLRSRAATKINKTTVSENKAPVNDAAAVSCSLENPELCEACQ